MAKDLYELIDSFRGMTQVEDIMNALEGSCFIRKLQLNGVLENIVFDEKSGSYLDCLRENVKAPAELPIDLNDMASCLRFDSLVILEACVRRVVDYTDTELKELITQLQSESVKRMCNTTYRVDDTEEGISKLVNYLVKDKNYKSVLDLCSGSGSFLLQNVLNENRNKLVGYEYLQKNVIFSKMMSYVLDGNLEIHNEDVLATSVDGKYDLCFTQCPLGLRYKQKIMDDYNGLLGFDHFGVKVDWAFVFKAINAMNTDGKTFAILSHSSVSNNVEMKSRQLIIDNGLLEKVIVMPQGTLHYTNIQYYLLVFSNGNDKVTFVDASSCYTTDKKMKLFDLESFKKTEKTSAYTFSYEEIENKNYSFDLSRYLYTSGISEKMNPVALNECADVIGGYVYNTHKKIESPVAVKMIKVENFKGSLVDTVNAEKIEIEESKVSNYLIQKGDILLASKGTIIRAAIVQNVEESCIFNSNINVIRIKQGVKMIPEFLLSYLNSDLGMNELKMLQTGTTVMSVSLKSLREMDVPVVDMNTQEVIEIRFNKLQQKLEEAKRTVTEYEKKINSLFDMEVGD